MADAMGTAAVRTRRWGGRGINAGTASTRRRTRGGCVHRPTPPTGRVLSRSALVRGTCARVARASLSLARAAHTEGIRRAEGVGCLSLIHISEPTRRS
eukprot:1516289-Prymnesium_polylepis.1